MMRVTTATTPKKVLLAPYFVLNWLYHPMITLMRERWGSQFVILKPERGAPQKALAKVCGPEGRFIAYPDTAPMLKRLAKDGAPASVFEEARQNEEKYGITYIIEVLQHERDVARAMMPGVRYNPFARPEPASMEALCAMVNFYFSYFETLFRENEIDLVLVWPRTALEAVCTIVARHRGIPVTYPYSAKYKNFMYWASDPTCGNESYVRAFKCVQPAGPMDLDVSPIRPKNLEQQRIDSRYSLTTALRSSAIEAVDRVLFFFEDIREGRLFRAYRLPFRRDIGRIWGDWWFYRCFSALAERDIARLKSRPYAFFAFQNEPEFSVQMRCKEFTNQLAVVRQLALSLPADMRLVMKEHTWLGNRSISAYKELLALPNVVMAHPSIPATALIPDADVVASFGGSVTLEAATNGKPALVFNGRSEFAALPSVTVVRDLTILPALISRLRREAPSDTEKYRAGASKFIEATRHIGVEAMTWFDPEKSAALPAESVERAMSMLLDVIELQNSQSESARSAAGPAAEALAGRAQERL